MNRQTNTKNIEHANAALEGEVVTDIPAQATIDSVLSRTAEEDPLLKFVLKHKKTLVITALLVAAIAFAVTSVIEAKRTQRQEAAQLFDEIVQDYSALLATKRDPKATDFAKKKESFTARVSALNDATQGDSAVVYGTIANGLVNSLTEGNVLEANAATGAFGTIQAVQSARAALFTTGIPKETKEAAVKNLKSIIASGEFTAPLAYLSVALYSKDAAAPGAVSAEELKTIFEDLVSKNPEYRDILKQ